MTEKKEIAPMYIVGNIEDGKFKQVLYYSGYSGNRLFSRKRDAVNFYVSQNHGYSKQEIHVYEITQVSDCTDEIDEIVENPELIEKEK